LKNPFSTATYGVIDSKDGGLSEEPILIFAVCASPKPGIVISTMPNSASTSMKRKFLVVMVSPFLNTE